MTILDYEDYIMLIRPKAHLPLQTPPPFIAAAMIVPVPRGLVRMSASPGLRPPFRIAADSTTSPLMVNPS